MLCCLVLPELVCGEPAAVLVTVGLAAVAEECVEVLRVLLGDLPRGHQRAAVLQQRLLVLNTGNIGDNCPVLELELQTNHQRSFHNQCGLNVRLA